MAIQPPDSAKGRPYLLAPADFIIGDCEAQRCLSTRNGRVGGNTTGTDQTVPRRFGTRPDASPPRSALDLLAKNQGHIASGVFQQFLARDTNLGAKLQTLQQVNEQTASHLGRGCASQAPRLYLLLETFRENISGSGQALLEPGTDLRYPLRLSQRSGGHHAAAASLASSRSRR